MTHPFRVNNPLNIIIYLLKMGTEKQILSVVLSFSHCIRLMRPANFIMVFKNLRRGALIQWICCYRFWHGVLWFGKGKRIFPVNIKRYRAGDSGNSSNPFSSQKRYVNKTRQKCVGSSSFVRFEDFFCKREKRNGGFPRWYNPPPENQRLEPKELMLCPYVSLFLAGPCSGSLEW